jgi:hypothetical protein
LVYWLRGSCEAKKELCMFSSWEERKRQSNYHFDNDIIDPRWDNVIGLGRFVGDWRKELVRAIEISKPTSWATRGRTAPKPEDLMKEEYDLMTAGMDPDYKVTNLTWEIAPIFQKIVDSFAVEDVMARVHVQWPGQVWNLHIDKLEKWAPDNPDSVFRAFIALTDWQQGHFWSFGNYLYTGWKAGDAITFDWQNVPHSTANAGHTPRVTLQVTGIRTPQTDNFLNQLKKAREINIS